MKSTTMWNDAKQRTASAGNLRSCVGAWALEEAEAEDSR